MKNELLLILFTGVLAISHHHHEPDTSWLSVLQENSVEKDELKVIIESKIGSAILKMAELNTKVQGPIDELIETIRSFE